MSFIYLIRSVRRGLAVLGLSLAIIAPALAQAGDIYSCVTDLVNDERASKAGSRSVHQPSKKWIPGQVIRVRFLEGSDYVKGKVMQYAQVWERFANIDFVFVESGPAEIRITFTLDRGSWSYHGKDSAFQSMVRTAGGPQFVKNATGASMNFGWFNEKTTDEEFRRTTLHEFGHALGLRHEHQNKNQNIQWNEEAVYEYFAKQGWSREKTFAQVLKRYGPENEVSNGVYDPLSIMHYWYPPELIKGGVKMRENRDLSEGDKRIIAEMYPFDDNAVVRPPVSGPLPPKPAVPPAGPVFSFSDVSVDYEGFDEKTEQDGMVFTSDFKVKNGLKQEFTMAIYFYEADGTPLKDSNKKYFATNGNVAVFKKFTPSYADAVYNGFEIFMPYDELELEECGEQNLKYSIGIWNGQKRIVSTGYTYFELDVPCED